MRILALKKGVSYDGYYPHIICEDIHSQLSLVTFPRTPSWLSYGANI